MLEFQKTEKTHLMKQTNKKDKKKTQSSRGTFLIWQDSKLTAMKPLGSHVTEPRNAGLISSEAGRQA